MNAVDRIARAVLYEGYVLYPYRPSSLKNSRRCPLGALYPAAYASGPDRSEFRSEVLLRAGAEATLRIVARFLDLAAHENENGAVEREAAIEATVAELSAGRREQFRFGEIEGEVEAATSAIAPGVYRVSVRVRNTASLDGADPLARALASAHAALHVTGGEFVSATDPPEDLADAAAACVNEGVWPVLAGGRDTMLASPIILPDYPQVAPESAGDLYDGAEIEEILTLRILTLTDAEKAEVRASEGRAREILERSEALPAEHVMRLHGVIRGMGSWDAWAASAPPQKLAIGGVEVKPGDRVRLHPQGRADIFDIALDGRIGIVAGIEQDFEGKVQVAVVAEDDPGRDLGEMRQIGHRFFFSPAELEPIASSGVPNAQNA